MDSSWESFSTAPVPAAAAAAAAGIRLAQSAEGEARRKALFSRLDELNSGLKTRKSGHQSAIVPLIYGDEKKAVLTATDLQKQNIFVPAIRYPTVARGAARLRVTLTAAHTAEDVATLCAALPAIPG